MKLTCNIVLDLDKDFILESFGEIGIFSYYLNIPSDKIEKCINYNKCIKNPLREDKHPSLGFFYRTKDKRLIARDFTGFIKGDCFAIVAYILGVNINSKDGFKIVLNNIWNNLGNSPNTPINHNYVKTNKVKTINKITVSVREFNNYDAKYWLQFGIALSSLKLYNIFPVNAATYNGNLIFKHRDDYEPCYAYYLGTVNDIEIYELYRPNTDRSLKFKNNYSVLKGLLFTKPNKYLLITKSYKDLVCLKLFINNYLEIKDVDIISFPSESHLLNNKQLYFITKNYKYIYTLFDFDLTGIRAANYLRKKYKFIPLFFTNGRFNSINYKAKDFTDYIKSLEDKKDAFKLIKEVYNNINYGK